MEASALFYTLEAGDMFGWDVAAPGDIDGDGTEDFVVSAYHDNDGGTEAGAVYVLFLETNANTKSVQKLSMLYGGISAFYTLDAGDEFGSSVTAMGDIDGDGALDLAVGARQDDDGSSNPGAFYILFLTTDGNVRNAQKLSMLYGGFDAYYTLSAVDKFGISVAAVGDIDGDGVEDLTIGAYLDDDGGTIAGAIYVINLAQSYCETPSPTVSPPACFTDGTAKAAQKQSVLYGNFNTFYTLDASDRFGVSVVALGDVDSDGIRDLAVGAELDSDGGSGAGAVYVLFLETDGSIKGAQKLSMLYGNLNMFYALDASDVFGVTIAALGDLDGDSVVDMAVGAWKDDDGAADMGAAYIFFLQIDGTIKNSQKLSALYGGVSTFFTLNTGGRFAMSLAGMGDADSDGIMDLAVGADYDDDGGANAGAVYIIYLQTDGTTKNAQKFSMLYGGLSNFYTLDASDSFGFDVAAPGDIDGDSANDLAVGTYGDNDGGSAAGAVYVLLLETNAYIKLAQKLSMLYGGISVFYTLDAGDRFGTAVTGLGDAGGDGSCDLAVGARSDDDGGTDVGAVYVLLLKTDGNLKKTQKLSVLYGGFNSFYTLGAGDLFGSSVATVGDIDGDGVEDMQ